MKSKPHNIHCGTCNEEMWMHEGIIVMPMYQERAFHFCSKNCLRFFLQFTDQLNYLEEWKHGKHHFPPLGRQETKTNTKTYLKVLHWLWLRLDTLRRWLSGTSF